MGARVSQSLVRGIPDGDRRGTHAWNCPIVARHGNGGADFVDATRTGAVYSNSVIDALKKVRDHNSELNVISRNAYEQHLTIDSWTQSLSDLYESLVAQSSR